MLHVVMLQDWEMSITMLFRTSHIENQWNTEKISIFGVLYLLVLQIRISLLGPACISIG